VNALLEAVAALSIAAGHFRELGRDEVAHRCDTAAARLQLLVDQSLDEDVDGVTDSREAA
jgi:hypothetical protein